MMNREVLNFNWKELTVHLQHRTVAIVIGECFCVESCTSDDEFEGSLAVLHCFLDQRKQYIRIETPFMSLVENYDLVLEQEGIADALSHKDSVCDVFQACCVAGLVVESNGIAYFLSEHF